MKAPQVTESLQRLFTKERNRIVFWYDPEREFEESLDSFLPLRIMIASGLNKI